MASGRSTRPLRRHKVLYPFYRHTFPLLISPPDIRDLPTLTAEKEVQVAAAHRTALEKEQAEVSRLRQELAKSQHEQAEMTKVMNEVTEAQETLVADLQSRASLAENKLSVLTAKCDTWLAELRRINSQMDSEFPSLLLTEFPMLPRYFRLAL